MRVAVTLSALALAAGAAGCVDTLQDGEFGEFRYIGQVYGKPPLQLLPPAFDREGNIYVAYGAADLENYAGFVGSAGGYWASFGFDPTRELTIFTDMDKYGTHGWIGHAFQQQLLWAGDMLINIDGYSRQQYPYLTYDPNTQVRLNYRAVIPFVKDTPSRTTLVAFIQARSDPLPFHVVINLRTGLYENVHTFSPSNATDLTFLGVGYDKTKELGVVLLRFAVNGATHVEARFLDKDANLVATSRLNAGADLPPYSIQGWLEANDNGLFAGLDDRGELITLDQSGGRIHAIGGMKPVGVHTFEGKLWLVGTGGNGPVVAPIDDSGNLGGVVAWTASRTASSLLKQTITVIDDRRLPSHAVTWKARNAMGAYPFVTPYNPEVYADGETGWIVSGPSYNVAGGGEIRTAIAFAPVGISYP